MFTSVLWATLFAHLILLRRRGQNPFSTRQRRLERRNVKLLVHPLRRPVALFEHAVWKRPSLAAFRLPVNRRLRPRATAKMPGDQLSRLPPRACRAPADSSTVGHFHERVSSTLWNSPSPILSQQNGCSAAWLDNHRYYYRESDIPVIFGVCGNFVSACFAFLVLQVWGWEADLPKRPSG